MVNSRVAGKITAMIGLTGVVSSRKSRLFIIRPSRTGDAMPSFARYSTASNEGAPVAVF
jgi:hypothetical protein